MENTLLYKKLPASLKNIAIFPEDSRYTTLRSSYMKKGAPQLILQVKNEKDIQESLTFIQQVNTQLDYPLAVSIRSGGHGMSGASTNDHGVIIDLSDMNAVAVVDERQQLVRVQAGADWGKVAITLAPYDLVITSGNFGDVGVGGLAGSGGIGYFVRSQGLTLDHIVGATLVTASGDVLQVSEKQNSDLFWGIKGGASQLGIVTEFIFKAHKINSDSKDATIIYQNVNYSVQEIATFVVNWGQWISQTPRKMTSFLMIQKQRPHGFKISATNVWDGTDTTNATPHLETALSLGTMVDHHELLVPYPQIIPYPQSHHAGQQRIQIRDALVNAIDLTLGNAIAEAFSHPAAVAMELRYIGGALNDIPVEESAWAARWQVGFVDLWLMPVSTEQQDTAFLPLKKLATGAYGAYSSDTSAQVAALAWPNQTGKRLKKLREKVDPNQLFNQGLHLD